MKNENKIVEILAESLQKQDQHSELLTKLVDAQVKTTETLGKHGEILTKHGEILTKHGEILTKHGKILIDLTSEVKGLRQDFHKMNDHLLTRQEKMEDRIGRLEDKVFTQGESNQ